MKKWLAAAAMAAALGMGGAASADDLRLPGGGVLPLGPAVTVWEGSRSYFSKDVNRFLESPEPAEGLAEGLVQYGLYEEKEKGEALQLAESMMRMARAGKAYQLRSVHGDTMYTAYVFSVPVGIPIPAEEQNLWLSLAERAEKKRGAAEQAEDLAAHGELAQIWDTAMHVAQGIRRSRGVSAKGIPYEWSRIDLVQEHSGYAVPLSVYGISTYKEGVLAITVVWAGQADGRYFEPYLKKAAEGAQ